MKRCACGKTYSAPEWARLELLGITDGEDGTFLVMRNCACGSTLAHELDTRKDDEWLALTGVLAEMAGLRVTT